MNTYGTVNTSSSFIGNINPFRYRGYYYDTETGFYYLQTRYYDPTICRFINADNYELVAELSSVAGQLNLYAYANNNPIMLTDETGEFAGWTLVLIGVIVGALAGGHIAGKEAVNNGKEGWDLAGSIILGITVGAATGAAAVSVGTAIASVLPGVAIKWEFTKQAVSLGFAVSNIIGSIIGPLKSVDWPMFEWGNSAPEVYPNTTPYGDIAGMSRKIFTGKSPIRQYYCV